MKYPGLMMLLLLQLLGRMATAQSFEGVWKGTSLCKVKNSPCHDENVVYHISKNSIDKTYMMQANKVVDGKELDMGTIIFTYDDKQKSFVSVDSVRNAKWEFKLTGNVMNGTLMYKGDLFRIIDAKKEN